MTIASRIGAVAQGLEPGVVDDRLHLADVARPVVEAQAAMPAMCG